MTTNITGTITVIAITLTLTVTTTTTCHKVGVKYLVSENIEDISSARIRDVIIYWSLLSCVVYTKFIIELHNSTKTNILRQDISSLILADKDTSIFSNTRYF